MTFARRLGRQGAVRTHSPIPLPLDVWLMHKLTWWLAILAVALFLILGANWAMRQSIFNLRSVAVQSTLIRSNPAQLQLHIADEMSGNFFTLDMAHARSVLEEATWIRRALVQREFPNRLKVQLQEHQPVAFWGSEGDTKMVNSYGELFDGIADDVQDLELPILGGAADQSYLIWEAYQRLSLVFATMDNAMVDELQVTPQGGWRVSLDNGSSIELGQGSIADIETRTSRFVATFRQVASQYGRALESADLRYPNGYAIRLRGITTELIQSTPSASIVRNPVPSPRTKKPPQKRR